MSPAISIRNLGKRYRVNHAHERAPYRTLRDSLTRVATSPLRRLQGEGRCDSQDFWALKDVSFEVQPGEVVGIIGRNGAGKSTLLKILSRITKPTTGEVEINGRVGSLLEVGTGFHPELSGRENIYMNGSILGMSRSDIARRFSDIVDFSGVGQFIDTPVKRYSSGMYVRLAFAVAANLDPDIYLVDEVLAVGDHAFQNRCIDRLGQIAGGGRPVVLVSHNLAMLLRLCTSVIWLERGELVERGEASTVIQNYCERGAATASNSGVVRLNGFPGRPSWATPILESVQLLDSTSRSTTTIPLGSCMTVEIGTSALNGRSDSGIVIDICDAFGGVVAQLHSRIQSSLDLDGVNAATIRCNINAIPLLPGRYYLSLAVGDLTDFIDRVDRALDFTIEPADIYGTGRVPLRSHGLLALDASWERDEA